MVINLDTRVDSNFIFSFNTSQSSKFSQQMMLT